MKDLEKIPTIPNVEELKEKAKADIEREKTKEQIETVNRANEASVLMTVLCEKMGLKPHETTHQTFVQAFSDLQKASLEAQKQLQEKFITTPVPEKMRKTRQLKNV